MLFKKIEKTVHIEGMHCKHCAAHVEEALKTLPGVKSVSVNLEKKEASIISAKPLSDESIKDVIEQAGYKVI